MRLSAGLAVVCASVLPVVAIAVLYSVVNTTHRLVAIGVFTALFSIALSVFTNGRAIEIFSATSAYVYLRFYAFV